MAIFRIQHDQERCAEWYMLEMMQNGKLYVLNISHMRQKVLS